MMAWALFGKFFADPREVHERYLSTLSSSELALIDDHDGIDFNQAGITHIIFSATVTFFAYSCGVPAGTSIENIYLQLTPYIETLVGSIVALSGLEATPLSPVENSKLGWLLKLLSAVAGVAFFGPLTGWLVIWWRGNRSREPRRNRRPLRTIGAYTVGISLLFCGFGYAFAPFLSRSIYAYLIPWVVAFLVFHVVDTPRYGNIVYPYVVKLKTKGKPNVTE